MGTHALGFKNDISALQMLNCRIVNNVGGALLFQASLKDSVISNCTFENNIAMSDIVSAGIEVNIRDGSPVLCTSLYLN